MKTVTVIHTIDSKRIEFLFNLDNGSVIVTVSNEGITLMCKKRKIGEMYFILSRMVDIGMITVGECELIEEDVINLDKKYERN